MSLCLWQDSGAPYQTARTGKHMTTLLDTEIARLARQASKVITQHANHHGVCAVCTSAFPCDRAVLAEHNLAICSGCLPPERAKSG